MMLDRLRQSAKVWDQELDTKLIDWFESKRTMPVDEQQTTTIIKELITFKLFIRQGSGITSLLNINQTSNKCSQKVLNLGVNGSFPAQDICNMDERPLALWEDQSKCSLNYMNTPNEVESILVVNDFVL
ncbi:unnamed protein product [Didymodactylos carnosus]|uniref:Uncharacterized protein n=1 Tax=Didymodactylos carnosus TaxID=1234261 RepID=A0A815SK57_9BILA|nr:unnamed protein product [Didymodactylos carnosus]CAF1490859.1 unnamed protein product [Didymodactylos carnosus]CAF3696660.1 unnamed protein product [Didymodactylos carnosus]CAF4353905.1 unnamed protein product [Didymodactylos carnosus]